MVKLLHTEVYGGERLESSLGTDRQPLLGQIEAAIRRLDRFRYPYVWLFLSEDVDDSRDLNETLQVMGGKGAYYLNLNAGEIDNGRDGQLPRSD